MERLRLKNFIVKGGKEKMINRRGEFMSHEELLEKISNVKTEILWLCVELERDGFVEESRWKTFHEMVEELENAYQDVKKDKI